MTESLRVLVVDDDFMVASIHTRFVDRMDGFEVVGTAATAATAMTASIERCPRLARIEAVMSAVSPGTGMPIVSMAMSRKTTGRPTFAATSTKVAKGGITTPLLACSRCPP